MGRTPPRFFMCQTYLLGCKNLQNKFVFTPNFIHHPLIMKLLKLHKIYRNVRAIAIAQSKELSEITESARKGPDSLATFCVTDVLYTGRQILNHV
jgi:hypothetical protein